MATISRAQWDARPAAKAEPLDATRVVGLAFHWPGFNDASDAIRGVASVAAALRSWQRMHMDDKGWRDIAYQVAVDQDGNRYALRGLDGESAANGDQDVNERYGAVLLVLAPGEQPSDAMIHEVQAVVADHRALFPRSKLLVGHQQIRPEPTACPGPLVMRLLGEGAFEPGPTPSELLRADLRAAIDATKAGLQRAGSPRRPRIQHHLKRALEALRGARDLNQGD